MGDSAEQHFRIKSLVLPPANIRPVAARGNLFDKLRSMVARGDAPAARSTVAQPSAFPFGAVALIDFYKSTQTKPQYLGSATGFFVKHDLLVTAAHNIYYSGANMIAAFPGWDTELNQSAMVAALRWVQSTTRDVSIILTQPVAPMSVSIGGSASSSAMLVGYAFDYPDGTKRMSSGSGPCQVQGQQSTYGIAAQQGDSGGPIFSAGNIVMALHTQLTAGSNGTMLGGGETVDAQFISIATTLEAQVRTG